MKRFFGTPGLSPLLLSWMAAVSTAAWALAGTADTPRQPGTRAHAASGPHSDGADAVMQSRQRSTGAGKASRNDQQFLSKAAASGRAEVEMGRLGQSRAQDSEVKRFAERMVQDHSRVNGELQSLGSSRGLSWPDEGRATGAASPASGSGMGSSMGSSTRTGAGTGTSAGSTTGTTAGTSAGTGSSSAASGAGTGMSSGSGSNAGTTGATDSAQLNLSAAARHSLERLQGLSGADFDREFMKQMVTDHKAAVADFQRAASSASDPEVKAFAQRTLPGLQEHLQMARSLSERLSASARH